MATYNGHQEDSSGNILLSIGNGMTATVETGSTASQAYTKGAYLFFNNRLCKASAAIASGATLAVGTNLTQTSLGAELTSHLRSSDGNEFYFDVKDGSYGYYPSASKVASEFVPFGGTDSELLATGTTTNNGSGKSFIINNVPEDTKLIFANCNLSSWSNNQYWCIDLDNNVLYGYSNNNGSFAVVSGSFSKSGNTVTVQHGKTGGSATVYYSCFS